MSYASPAFESRLVPVPTWLPHLVWVCYQRQGYGKSPWRSRRASRRAWKRQNRRGFYRASQMGKRALGLHDWATIVTDFKEQHP